MTPRQHYEVADVRLEAGKRHLAMVTDHIGDGRLEDLDRVVELLIVNAELTAALVHATLATVTE
jgi:hypothetical protein